MTESNLQATAIYHSNLESVVLRHLKTKEPMMLWSPPGCGKTEHMKQIIESAGYDFIDWRLAQMDAVDVRGIPYKGEDGRTHYAVPGTLPLIGCRPTVLFLDEIMQAHQSVVAPAGQIINERGIGNDYVLPDNVVVMAASNRHFDRAAANRMPAHTANRFLHYELVVRPLEWCEWAVDANIDWRVVSYIRFRPEVIYMFDPKQTEPAFASLRTWVKLSNMIDGLADNDPLIDTFSKASVGRAVGGEFRAFVDSLDKLPDIDDVIANPDNYDVPKDRCLQYAMVSALTHRTDESNVENVWKMMIKFDDEYQTFWAKDVIALGAFDLTQHPVYNEVLTLCKQQLTT
tara:strand:+ start:1994 stop:3025 length:1032 start_codon:yes stop_codon:yes gene_type:complete